MPEGLGASEAGIGVLCAGVTSRGDAGAAAGRPGDTENLSSRSEMSPGISACRWLRLRRRRRESFVNREPARAGVDDPTGWA